MIDLGDLIGKSYELNGGGPNSYNCRSLCVEVARRTGKILPDHGWFKHKFIQLRQPEPWCIVAFKIWENNKEKWHVGTILEDCRRFIHVTGGTSVCIVRLSHPVWNLLFEGYYKFAS